MQIESADEDDKQILTELLKDLEEHDGLVIARLSPMGAYIVHDLYAKDNTEYYVAL